MSKAMILILAGGRGTRLWPYSTQRIPKQFLSINNGPSPFTLALQRSLFVADTERIFISTNKANLPHVRRQLRGTSIEKSHILVKEDEYETGISVFSALRQLKAGFSIADEAVVAVLPSDHFVEPLEKYKRTFDGAVAVAQAGCIVALGKKPTSPQESYGYIVLGENNKKGEAYAVKQFVEKPARPAAEKLIAEGALWNLGMFFFPVGLMLKEFCAVLGVDSYQKVTHEMIASVANISFDRLIIEKTKKLKAVEGDFNWLDIGSWKAFYEMQSKDEKQNANPLHQVLEESQGSMAVGSGKPVVAIGLENVFLINHPEVLLAVSESHIDGLKKVMPLLEQKYPRLIKGDPMVSICTPVSNLRKHLSEAIESVLQQDYPLVEHVLLDFGSTSDATALKKAVDSLRVQYPSDGKVIDVIHQPGGYQGLYDAMNAAVTEATGEIIGILNSSDLLADRTAIKSIVEVMEKENSDVCWADLVYVKEHDITKIVRFWQSQRYQKGLFQKGWMPPNSAVFIRRSVFEKCGLFRTDLNVAGGYEFMLRVLEKEGVRNCYLPQIIVKMRDSGSPLLSRASIMMRGNAESYRAWKLNGLKVKPWFVFAKPFSKLNQLFNKHRGH